MAYSDAAHGVCPQFDPHRQAQFIEEYSYDDERMGEYGWSLTTLSGKTSLGRYWSVEEC